MTRGRGVTRPGSLPGKDAVESLKLMTPGGRLVKNGQMRVAILALVLGGTLSCASSEVKVSDVSRQTPAMDARVYELADNGRSIGQMRASRPTDTLWTLDAAIMTTDRTVADANLFGVVLIVETDSGPRLVRPGHIDYQYEFFGTWKHALPALFTGDSNSEADFAPGEPVRRRWIYAVPSGARPAKVVVLVLAENQQPVPSVAPLASVPSGHSGRPEQKEQGFLAAFSRRPEEEEKEAAQWLEQHADSVSAVTVDLSE